METPTQTPEHQWLQRMVGEWEYEGECVMGPDQPVIQSSGRDAVRSLGGLWMIAEGQGQMPDGEPTYSVMTLGYDAAAGRFVGTFTASMMTYLWVYNGSLDFERNVLTLDTVGPSFDGNGMADYQDSMEIVDDNHRILRSQLRGPDGAWFQFMSMHYHRK